MKFEKDQIAKLSPPWHTYHRKVLALFGRDPQVTIRDLSDDVSGNYGYFILVSDMEKAQAIKAILSNPVDLGATTVTAYIFGPDEDTEVKAAELDDAELIKNAFKDNPIIDSFLDTGNIFFSFTYCIFKKEVIQFYNDNLSDYCGNMSCLAEDLAREILQLNSGNVQFCTAVE